MKKLVYSLVFIVCAVIAFGVTKQCKPTPLEDSIITDTVDAVINDSDSISAGMPEVSDTSNEISASRQDSVSPATESKSKSGTEPEPKPTPTPVRISPQEVKALIVHGKYEKDARLSKKYNIEYEDVSDDDFGELQQNLTFVQQQVEFEKWRDFEVVGLDFDEQGKVNIVKIRPIY